MLQTLGSLRGAIHNLTLALASYIPTAMDGAKSISFAKHTSPQRRYYY